MEILRTKVVNAFDKVFRPWEIGKPYALEWGGWTKFDDEQKAKYPIRWFIFDTIPDYIGYKVFYLGQKKWEFLHKYIPKHKYHIIKTSLEPGYYDPDVRILYTTMDLIKEFVDFTKDTINWDDGAEHQEAKKEIDIIYNWWVNVYPQRENELPDFPDIDFGKIVGGDSEKHKNEPLVQEWKRISKVHQQAEEDWRVEEEEMLIRAAKVRQFLWYP